MTERTAEEATRIRWLKAVVIGLGIIFVGLAVLLLVLIMTGGPKRTASVAPSAPRPVSVEDLIVTLPKNSRVADVLATGNRIVLRVRLMDGTERLYALDGETLKPLGSVTVQVEK